MASSNDNDFLYFKKKQNDKIYVSGSFADDWSYEMENRRIVSRVFDSETLAEFVKANEEVVLRVTGGGRQEVKAVICEDTREVVNLVIQRFNQKDGKPHKYSFSFDEAETQKLYTFLQSLSSIPLKSSSKYSVHEDALEKFSLTEEEKKNIVLENPDLIKEVLKNDLTESDIVALGYRKKQLEIFQKLLEDPEYFKNRQAEHSGNGPEAVWQSFFEKNPWIFGYGLNIIFNQPLSDKKLEQVTTGATFNQSGKRVDALMKTRGLVSSLCFAEIKTHETPLINGGKPYRKECWQISSELAGSLAQIQKTVQKAVKDVQTKIEVTEQGIPTGETLFLYQPKAYLVVGCLKEFNTSNGINEEKFSSFELFRRNKVNPEIITFDELFERARFIVKNS